MQSRFLTHFIVFLCFFFGFCPIQAMDFRRDCRQLLTSVLHPVRFPAGSSLTLEFDSLPNIRAAIQRMIDEGLKVTMWKGDIFLGEFEIKSADEFVPFKGKVFVFVTITKNADFQFLAQLNGMTSWSIHQVPGQL